MKGARTHHHHTTFIYENGDQCLNNPQDLLPLIGLAVEAMLFGVFTSCMMIDQLDVVLSNVTHIDRLKGENHTTFSDPTNTPRYKGVHEVFGMSATRGFRLNWLAPFGRVTFPTSVKDEIMGFCTPCSSNHHTRDHSTERSSRAAFKGIRTAVNEIV
jgi:hypothetical protein